MMARRVCGSAMLYASTTDIIQIQTLVQTSSSLQYPGPRLSTVLGLSLHVVDDFAAFERKGENGRDDALDIVSIPIPTVRLQMDQLVTIRHWEDHDFHVEYGRLGGTSTRLISAHRPPTYVDLIRHEGHV
jgi:hypothetical protein